MDTAPDSNASLKREPEPRSRPPRADRPRLAVYLVLWAIALPLAALAIDIGRACRAPITVPAALTVTEGRLVSYERRHDRQKWYSRRYPVGFDLLLDSSRSIFRVGSREIDVAELAGRLRTGAPVSITHDGAQRPEVWALSIDGKPVLDVATAAAVREANRQAGLDGALLLGLAFIAWTAIVWYVWLLARR